MRKKLLFVMNHLHCGGAEKSLVSLLETIDYSKYEVDLFLFKHEGIFMNKIPKQVKLLEAPRKYKYFDMPIKAALIDCLIKGYFVTALARLQLSLTIRLEKNEARREQLVWKFISSSFTEIEGSYDAAIGFLEKNPIYYVVDKVKSRRKLGWIHTNYTNLGMDNQLDTPFFEKLDYIVTVSDECSKSLQDEFRLQQQKIKVIHNIVSPSVVRHMAESKLPHDPEDDNSCINIITIARLSHVKGIDLAIEACKLLLECGYKVKWSVLGQATDKELEDCTQLIAKLQLQEHFKLLGIFENPYPYLKKADIIVQPSRLEGKSIAIDEAKIMHKPIVVTNFSTAKDQIVHGQNGLIVDMDPKAIAWGIQSIIDDVELRNKLTLQLSKEKLGTEYEIEKLYQLIY